MHRGATASRAGVVVCGQISAPGPDRKTRRVSIRTQSTTLPSRQNKTEYDQSIREGHTETEYVCQQKNKARDNGPRSSTLTQSLIPWDSDRRADVAIVGCGPAGMSLAAETAKRGLTVVLIGEDVPFVNNYGVWVDEFEELELVDTLANIWPQTVCYFGEEQEVTIDRSYGRVDLEKLHAMLLKRCQEAGVAFHEGFVDDIDSKPSSTEVRITCKDDARIIKARMVSLASGATAGKFLEYETGVPSPGAQTAYGIEVEVDNYAERYPANKMLFMDYRRHHSGIWPGAAPKIKRGQHPDGGDGLWNTHREIPSFLYAMPLGPNRAFLEETCLVAKPPLPFAQLKRRLERRIEAMGLTIKRVYDEEWSYIPVGGPLPVENQAITAFGSAANLIHPASGYSISRSLREAPVMADAFHTALASNSNALRMSTCVWSILWTNEKRTQASFHVFGMELLARLPPLFWRRFLSASIDSTELLNFAVLTFMFAPLNIKTRLISHLIEDPSGIYMMEKFRHRLRDILIKKTEESSMN